uniref:Uncharacterized protein n=1 Tax=Micrurus carvalhoi TaxID=3147026 RepID=A0A2H6NKX5_9SAUR
MSGEIPGPQQGKPLGRKGCYGPRTLRLKMAPAAMLCNKIHYAKYEKQPVRIHSAKHLHPQSNWDGMREKRRLLDMPPGPQQGKPNGTMPASFKILSEYAPMC